jgi:hypothetical protein
MIPETID